MRDASLDAPLSILDEQLAERLAKAFSFHPWVAEVREVRKSIPARVTIDLVYRRPVCMVELPDRSGLYAVDAQAFLLPSRDFLDEPQKAAQYPRLAGITSVNIGRVGVSSVSYTHLDVYKRQSRCRPWRISQVQKSAMWYGVVAKR